MWKKQKISRIQREKLTEMGLKRKGFLKLLVGCKAILKVLDEEGPLTRSQVMKLTKTPRGTIDRYLRFLTELGCVERMGRKYVPHSNIYIYKNKTNRDLALNHSKNVASGLQHLIIGMGYRPLGVEEPLPPNEKYREPALEHLRTALDSEYRKAYKTLKEAEEVGKRLVNEESRFREGIKAKLLFSPLRLLPNFLLPQPPSSQRADVAHIVAENVYKDIKEVLRGCQPLFLTNLKVNDKNETVVSGGYHTLAGKDEFEPLRQFVMREEKSEGNVNVCKRIAELEDEHYTLEQKFEELAKRLIMQVLNGTPLKGKCGLCPKVISGISLGGLSEGAR